MLGVQIILKKTLCCCMDSNTYQFHWHGGKHKRCCKLARIKQNLSEKLYYFMLPSIYQFQWLDAQMLLKPRRICPVITIWLLCQQRIKKRSFFLKYPRPTLENSLAEFAIVCIHLISYFLSFFSSLPSFLSCLSFSRSRQTTLSLTT